VSIESDKATEENGIRKKGIKIGAMEKVSII